MITAKVKKQGFFQKMKKLRREIDKQSMDTVEQITTLGKYHAKTYVPHHSGSTYNAIRKRTYKKQEGAEGKIFIEPKQPQDNHKRNMANFDLVLWMHTSGRAQGHIKTGSRKFMWNARDYLNTIKTRVAKGNFNKINIK